MALDYALLLAAIGVPLMILILKFIGVLELLYEISATVWMLPI